MAHASFSVKPVEDFTNVHPQWKDKKYPEPGHSDLPTMFWMGLWVGGRGSGKTYSCVRLLKLYEKFGLYLDGKSCYQRIILMSPTLDANPIWKSLKHFNYKEGDYQEKYSD